MGREPKVFALYGGTFSVGLDKKFVPIGPDEDAAKGALRISLNPFLILHEDRVMLLDTGLGDFGEESQIPVLSENLEKHGFTFDDITDVFLSHLHFDHIGGLAHCRNGFWQLTFPDARVWLSGEEWNKLLSLEQKETDKEQFLHYIDVHADLNPVHDGDRPFEGVFVRVIGGHTEFSLAWFFQFGGLKMLNAGDVIGTKSSLNRKYSAKYDFDGKKSQEVRDELSQLAKEEGFTILAYHDSKSPIFSL